VLQAWGEVTGAGVRDGELGDAGSIGRTGEGPRRRLPGNGLASAFGKLEEKGRAATILS
jgi:hypothetical protein